MSCFTKNWSRGFPRQIRLCSLRRRLEVSVLGSRGILSVKQKQRCWSAVQLPHSCSAASFLHMQKC